MGGWFPSLRGREQGGLKMTRGIWWLPALVLAGAATCAWSADAPKPADAAKPAEKTQTWTGQLSKSSQALANLKTQPEDKKEKGQLLMLFAKQGDAKTAKAITDLVQDKHPPYVSVTGVLQADGKSVLVTSIEKTDPPHAGH
jgi:hypothetical protein